MAADSAKPKKGASCPKCGNRLRVRPNQTGEQVRCPKCNATFTIGRPPKPPPLPASPDAPYEPEIPLKKAAIVPEDPPLLDSPGETQAIIPEEPGYLGTGDAAPVVEPMEAPPTSYLPQYTADWATDEIEVEPPHERPPSDPPDYLANARERGLLREEPLQPIPKWTFFSGVFTFPWWRGNIGRWIGMTVGLAITGQLVLAAVLEILGGLGLGGIGMPILMMLLAAMSLVTFMFCSACFLAAVDDTADGHDEPQEATFPPLDQWLFSFFGVAGIWLMSGALGYPFSLVPAVGPAAILVSSFVLFPILLLSAMECDSFFLPWSPNVWKTLVRFPGSWLMFYLISTAVLAAWYVSTAIGLQSAPALAVLLGALALAAVILVYARLLGRLAWRITYVESDARRRKPAGQPQSQPVAAPRKGKKRRKVRKPKLQLPDDLDQPRAGPDDRPPAPRSRLDFHRRP